MVCFLLTLACGSSFPCIFSIWGFWAYILLNLIYGNSESLNWGYFPLKRICICLCQESNDAPDLGLCEPLRNLSSIRESVLWLGPEPSACSQNWYWHLSSRQTRCSSCMLLIFPKGFSLMLFFFFLSWFLLLSNEPSNVLNIMFLVIYPGSTCILMGEPFLFPRLPEMGHYCSFYIFLLGFLSSRNLLEANWQRLDFKSIMITAQWQPNSFMLALSTESCGGPEE